MAGHSGQSQTIYTLEALEQRNAGHLLHIHLQYNIQSKLHFSQFLCDFCPLLNIETVSPTAVIIRNR